MSHPYGIDVSDVDSQLHPIFKTDPQELSSFLNKKVSLKTTEGLVFEGWVYTIDPVTRTWVLMKEHITSTQPDVQLVMNSAVVDVKVTENDCPEAILHLFSDYGQEKQVEMDASELVARRDAICRWFGISRIPVERKGESISLVNGVLTIEPPYFKENCYSSNEIVLDRIRTLLGSMPTDLDLIS